MTSDAPTVHAVGSKVWIRDTQNGWIAADVQKIEGTTLTVKVDGTGELRTAATDDAPLQNEDANGVEVRRFDRRGGRAIAPAPARMKRRIWEQGGNGLGLAPTF